MSQYQQDELARLFAHNMSLNQPLPQSTPDKQFLNHHSAAQPVYFTSQHYTPTSYLHVSQPAEQHTNAAPRADSPLSGGLLEGYQNLTPIHLASMLRNHDIDPTSLNPSQVKLFTNADYEQRLRLLELWRISPPETENLWQQETNLAHEEQLAALRYEERMRARQYQATMDLEDAEPYITSGYAHSTHSEPVYAACSSGSWQAQHDRPVREMEDAYGAFEQARNFERLQAMNAQVEQQRITPVHDVAVHDDDMEL